MYIFWNSQKFNTHYLKNERAPALLLQSTPLLLRLRIKLNSLEKKGPVPEHAIVVSELLKLVRLWECSARRANFVKDDAHILK